MRLTTAVLILAWSAQGAVGQGSLTPPAGAPAPTFKTLTQVEPRTAANTLPGAADCRILIDKPGSYYLTGNVLGGSGLHGIKITAEGVNLDLSGFEVIGGAGSVHWIDSSFRRTNICNGVVREWGNSGVRLASNCAVERLQIVSNNKNGIVASTNPGGKIIIRNTAVGSTVGNYVNAGGSNATTFGPVSTNVSTNTNPNANFSF